MAFIDELKIYAKAGNGGNGIVSWLRLRFLAKGGPAGGNGGNGGNVYFKTVRDLSVLSRYTKDTNFNAEKGGDGRKFSKTGKNGRDLYIDIPIGSKITNLNDKSEIFLFKEGEEFLALEGGRGGFGNEHFKSSRNISPEEQTDGKTGEEGNFLIELELLVDLGFVGLPSAGKSSLLNVLTSTKSRVGSYPFTTLEPSLGIFYKYVLADIPGLIKGASEGKGLGFKFLKHIKRTKVIAHLISFENENMIKSYEEIREELEKYSEELIKKPEIIILSKSDLVSEKEQELKKEEFKNKFNKDVVVVSAIDDIQIKDLSKELLNFLSKF